MDCRVKPGNDKCKNSMPPPVFRFAPSPNGYLHLGHAFSALLNADLARQSGGRFLLRIEDIDATRCKPEFETATYEDLGWLGMSWETPVRRQSDHLASYRAAVEKLSADGLVYPSFESRLDIAVVRGGGGREEGPKRAQEQDPAQRVHGGLANKVRF